MKIKFGVHKKYGVCNVTSYSFLPKQVYPLYTGIFIDRIGYNTKYYIDTDLYVDRNDKINTYLKKAIQIKRNSILRKLLNENTL